MRPRKLELLARLMCWVLLCLPLMQTAAAAHELGHMGRAVTQAAVVIADDAGSPACNGVCSACLAFAAITGGMAQARTDHTDLPQEHLVWQSGPLPRFTARTLAAYASRAPPQYLA